jgi:hypothetical protein
VDGEDREVLDQCMERMAAGDPAFLFTFARHFAPHVANVVRRHLVEMGRRDVLADRDELDALVIDACDVIYGRAGGWQAHGALPWTWADRAIRSEVARAIGHRTVPSEADDERASEHGPECSLGRDGIDVGLDDFDALARRHPVVALLADAVARAGSARDQRVFVEYRLQKELGDPSPAHVVGREFGLTPANVRQIDCRMRRKLAAIIAATPGYAELRDVRWIAA